MVGYICILILLRRSFAEADSFLKEIISSLCVMYGFTSAFQIYRPRFHHLKKKQKKKENVRMNNLPSSREVCHQSYGQVGGVEGNVKR